jgi:hypothetical protein
MRSLKEQHRRYFVDWEMIDVEGIHSLHLLDPFDPRPTDAEQWLKELTLA